MMLPKRNWMEMTWQDIAGAAARPRAGSPCCRSPPWSSTARICRSASIPLSPKPIWRASALLPADLPVTFLPVQRIGVSAEHLSYPGTLTLSATTAIAAWTELGESLARAGLRKLVLVTSHGGNVAAMESVARELRTRLGMLAVTVGWHRFGYPDGTFHGGGEKARHSRRRYRDLADAGGEARDRAHGPGAERDAGDDRDGA